MGRRARSTSSIKLLRRIHKHADVWYEPDPEQAELRARLGWLGTMSADPCMFEPFCDVPDEDEIRECLRKLLTKHHQRVKDAKSKQVQAAQQPQNTKRPKLPRVWIMAPSLPLRIKDDFGLKQSEQWPEGISVSPDGYGLGWVSLRDLPRTDETLLLRLMAVGGPVFDGALEDLNKLPEGVWQKEPAKEMVLARRREIGQNATGSKLEQDFMTRTQQLVQEWKRELRDEFREEIRKELAQTWEPKVREEVRKELAQTWEPKLQQLREALLETYRARFGAVPQAIDNAVRGVHDIDQLAKWVALFATKSAEEITAALAAEKPNGANGGQ